MSTAAPRKDAGGEAQAVHAWRVVRLTGLGVPQETAEAVAGRIDWHDVAALVRSGCPASLAVTILE